jgi:lipid II:glycine glycyltransferase (peptidoglycan interpeptide bridge formation enzyme)
MAELKIITLKEKEHLRKLIGRCIEKDIHSSPDYLGLFQDYQGYEAFYVYYGDEHNYILVPYFKRPIHLSTQKLFDIISPWYYGGPISSIKDAQILGKLFSQFLEKFRKYCKENNIVTEFQRMNPLLKNHELYKNDLSLSYDRKIVYVDLRKEINTLYQEYDRHARKNINKATRSGLKVYADDSREGINKFIQIYTKSMKQKNAKAFYLFNEKFFHNIFERFKSDIKLFQVEYIGKIVCSSIELGKYGILHDYLRGVDSEVLPLRPNDILLHEILKWAKSAGFSCFNIGGGATSAEDDGIFRFKKSFSATVADFYVYKKIHNPEKYNELCEKKGKKQDELHYEKAQFFPEYLNEWGQA